MYIIDTGTQKKGYKSIYKFVQHACIYRLDWLLGHEGSRENRQNSEEIDKSWNQFKDENAKKG